MFVVFLSTYHFSIPVFINHVENISIKSPHNITIESSLSTSIFGVVKFETMNIVIAAPIAANVIVSPVFMFHLWSH